jgi:hypothetical protein
MGKGSSYSLDQKSKKLDENKKHNFSKTFAKKFWAL